MLAFLVEVAKVIVIFVAVCVCIACLITVWVIAREVAWIVKHENRKKYSEQEEKKE